MKERTIDSVEYTDYSLLRCLSKEIFGTAQHVDLLLMELTSEIQQNQNVYLQDVEDNIKDTYEKIFGKYAGTEKEKLKLVQYAVTRIEDDLPVGDLLMLAASSFLQTKIYVLRFTESNLSTKSYWKEYLPLRQRADRHGNKDSQTEFITLLEAESKRFYRIVAKTSECNCELTVPKVPSEEQDPVSLLSNADGSFVRHVRRMETLIDIIMDCIDQWLKSNYLLQQTCDKIVQELELRRRNVNIATISGSSTGILGAVLTAVGIGIAPITAGASVALAVAGGVLAATGGTVTLGAKFTETILNKNTLEVLKRYQNNFQELSKTVESKLEEFSNQIKRLDDIANDMKRRQELEAFDFSAVQSLPGIFRMAKGLTMIPLAMLRISARGITILGVVIGPLTSLIDFGFMAFSIRNMIKKNKTDISEELRKISCSLYACRRQIHVWAYGNQKDFILDSGNPQQKEMN
ncbi:uncharacterized protein LOC134281184 [Saccostrea cucullata]|uniref:uncharacterized protein LOC134281184 n=1 Tax=Saccostrea cuccullata TaxID=36930 RepID=UPI002ED3C563